MSRSSIKMTGWLFLCAALMMAFLFLPGLASADTLFLPSGTQVIEEEAFCGDISITSVILPDTVESIGDRAFADSGLIYIQLSSGLTYISPSAFDGIEYLEVDVEEGTWAAEWWEANKNAFGYESDTPSDYFRYSTYPGDTIQIDRYIGPHSVKNVVIPKYIGGKQVVNIAGHAFLMEDQLTSVIIPEGVISIGEDAFAGCENLTRVKIPGSITSVGRWAFRECYKLKTAGPIGGGYNIEFGWTEAIPANAFYSSEITQVTIPSPINDIGSWAFAGCYNLTKITIPESVEIIRGNLFSACEKLKTAGPIGGGYDVEFGWKEVIPKLAFSYSNLASVTIPYGITRIENEAFNGCNSLTSITIPGSVTSIEYLEFADCTQLKTAGPIGGGYDIEFGWTETLPDSAFAGSKLSTIVIPDSITSIGVHAFFACHDLTRITIPSSITYIGGSAFAYCNNLKSVIIESSLTCIDKHAFDECNANLMIYCRNGSKAEAYAIENDIQYTTLDSPFPLTNTAIELLSRTVEDTVITLNIRVTVDEGAIALNCPYIYLETSENLSDWGWDWDPDHNTYMDNDGGYGIILTRLCGKSGTAEATIVINAWQISTEPENINICLLSQGDSWFSGIRVPIVVDMIGENTEPYTEDDRQIGAFNLAFRQSATRDEIDHVLANLSVKASSICYRGFGTVKLYLQWLEFDIDNIKAYDLTSGEHTAGHYIGVKTVLNENNEPVPLFAVVIRGTNGTYREWKSNFVPGNDTVHYGFSVATERIRKNLNDYITWYYDNIDTTNNRNYKLWITGHSRGAACGNILAATFNGTSASNIYAYLFATPNTTKSPVAANNIKNFVFSNDAVPRVPPYQYGYDKNGTTYWINADNEILNKKPLTTEDNVDILINIVCEIFPNPDDLFERMYSVFDNPLMYEQLNYGNAIALIVEIISKTEIYPEDTFLPAKVLNALNPIAGTGYKLGTIIREIYNLELINIGNAHPSEAYQDWIQTYLPVHY